MKTPLFATYKLSLVRVAIGLMACLMALSLAPRLLFAKKAAKPTIKAAITAQIVSLVAKDKVNIKVELTTLTPSPYYLKLFSYRGINGLKTLSAKQSAKGRRGANVKQRFQVVLLPIKVCQLKGQPSVFSFRILCSSRKGCDYRSKALHRVTIKLNTENYCATKSVRTK